MAIVVNITPQQFADYLGKLGQNYMPAAQRGVVSGAARCIPVMQRRTEMAPPASPKGSRGAFNTGQYKRAWRSAPLLNGARLYNLAQYSAVVEHGRRPAPVGRAGIENLALWAKRKLKLTDEEARAAAFAIAKSMEKRPLMGRHVMTGDVPGLERIIIEEIQHELDAALAAMP